MRISIILLLLVTFTVAKSQLLTGVVSDAKTGETLIGANIIIKNSEKYGVSGLDGSYLIKGLESGTYTIEVSYIGYVSKIKNIKIGIGDNKFNCSLKTKAQEIEGANIYASRIENTEASARQTERNSDNIVSVVSAKAIDISPDLDLASVVKRVSGVSLERNSNSMGKTYSIIRGMSKRYNYTLVNGIKISSPNDKDRYVPLDIFPSFIVGRVEVTKSLTADMEGDAVGGVINMVMKNAPDNLYIVANASYGYHSIYFNKDFQGFDSKVIDSKTPFQKYGYEYNATQKDFTTENIKMNPSSYSPDYSASFTFGNRFLKKKLGVLVSVSYDNSHKGSEFTRFVPDLLVGTSLPKLTSMYSGSYYSDVDQLGIHAKLDYRLGRHSILKFNYIKINMNENQIRDLAKVSVLGSTNILDSDRKTYQTRYRRTEQQINNFTLQGEHSIHGNQKLQWTLANSSARQDTPDEAYFSRITNLTLKQGYESILLAEDGDNNRIWRYNKDKDYSAKADYSINFETSTFNNELKIGGIYRIKNRTNFYNSYFFLPSPGVQAYGHDWKPDDPNIVYDTWEDYSEAKFRVGNPKGSTTNEFNHKFSDNYYAGYIQFSSTYNKKLKVIAGIRYENDIWNYTLLAPRPNQVPEGERLFVDVLPDFHLKYSLTKNSNLRLSYFYSIVRPSYYEILPYIDKNEDYIEIGNPEVKRTKADNFDLRYENFFGKTDVFMVGVFYKKLKNPIEYGRFEGEKTWSNISGWVDMPYNFGTATNYGFEFDFIKYIRKFGARINYTFTNSEITQTKQIKHRVDPNDPNSEIQTTLTTQTRPLQGQSKHIGNASILYKDTKRKIDAQLSFVYTGERIHSVSNYLDNDEWEKPYYTLDFSAQKQIKAFTFFVKAKNLLNTPYEVIIKQGLREDSESFPLQGNIGDDYIIKRETYNMVFLIGIRYKL